MEQQHKDKWEQVFISMSDRRKQANSIIGYIEKYGTFPDASRMTVTLPIEDVIEQYGYALTQDQIQQLRNGTTE